MARQHLLAVYYTWKWMNLSLMSSQSLKSVRFGTIQNQNYIDYHLVTFRQWSLYGMVVNLQLSGFKRFKCSVKIKSQKLQAPSDAGWNTWNNRCFSEENCRVTRRLRESTSWVIWNWQWKQHPWSINSSLQGLIPQFNYSYLVQKKKVLRNQNAFAQYVSWESAIIT